MYSRPYWIVTQRTFGHLQVVNTTLPHLYLLTKVHTEVILLLLVHLARRVDEEQRLHQGYTVRFRSLVATSFKNPKQGISHDIVHSTSMLQSELKEAAISTYLGGPRP